MRTTNRYTTIDQQYKTRLDSLSSAESGSRTALTLDQMNQDHVNLGLEHVAAVREAMALCPSVPIITVGGTNGKGSTCAFLEAILRAAGYLVGCYTSPHLLDVTERIRVNGLPVSRHELSAATERVLDAAGQTTLTYFELSTLAALDLFILKQVDVIVLEVGLGGRLDAVNVMDADCSIITSIDLDHTELLGATRELIGREKAGILRNGRPAVCGDPDPPDSLLSYAKELGTDLRCVGKNYSFMLSRSAWHFAGIGKSFFALPYPTLIGKHQVSNAACAIAALESLSARIQISVKHIAQGLQNAVIKGRFEKIAIANFHLILDVAHNPQSAEALAENLRQHANGGRRIAVFGMLKDKDIRAVIAATIPMFDTWLVSDIREPRGATAALLAAELQRGGALGEIEQFEDVTAAYKRSIELAAPGDFIVAFGSFRTVAGVLKALSKISEVPTTDVKHEGAQLRFQV